MPAKIYYDKDTDISLIKNKTIGIIGYGSQGHAHALNLKDSGMNVVVGLYRGSKSWSKAEQDGLKVAEVADVAKQADTLMMLVPDMAQRDVYRQSIAPNVRQGQTLMFAHGFNIHFKLIVPDRRLDVTMVAPKAPGHRVREIFQRGLGAPSLVAVHQDVTGKALGNALAYAKGIGSMRAGVIETTFKEETETDLFGEQTVLCGGVSSLVKTAFETLVKAGYQPEVAYFECMHELKLIVDLLYTGGLAYMRYSVSDTAEYGDYSRGPRVIDAHVRQEMEKILKEIQNGSFAKEWVAETDEGQKKFLNLREQERHHQIEDVGEKLRAMMPWLKQTT